MNWRCTFALDPFQSSSQYFTFCSTVVHQRPSGLFLAHVPFTSETERLATCMTDVLSCCHQWCDKKCGRVQDICQTRIRDISVRFMSITESPMYHWKNLQVLLSIFIVRTFSTVYTPNYNSCGPPHFCLRPLLLFFICRGSQVCRNLAYP